MFVIRGTIFRVAGVMVLPVRGTRETEVGCPPPLTKPGLLLSSPDACYGRGTNCSMVWSNNGCDWRHSSTEELPNKACHIVDTSVFYNDTYDRHAEVERPGFVLKHLV